MEARSKAEDCSELYCFLKSKLGKKIDYYGTPNTSLFSGMYYLHYVNMHNDYGFLTNDNLPFYMKFCKNAFLRIGVGKDIIKNTTAGEKLAVLSDFYLALVGTYGKPTVFYTTKDDDEELFTLQWSFIEREEEIAKFKNDTYFDDASIDKLIIFDEEKEMLGYKLQEQTKSIIEKRIGLPFELLPLVDENIDDYIKYKKWKKLKAPEDAKTDCLPVASFEDKYKKKVLVKKVSKK